MGGGRKIDEDSLHVSDLRPFKSQHWSHSARGHLALNGSTTALSSELPFVSSAKWTYSQFFLLQHL